MLKKPCILGLAICCLLLGLSAGIAAAAAEKFPVRPINMTIIFGTGTTDMTGRLLAKEVEKTLKVPVVVTNKPGGPGTTGIIDLTTKRNDGYNIAVISYAPLTIIPHQMDVPYTPADLDYIMAYGEFRYALYVRADSPWKNLDDVVKAAREKGALTYCANGTHQTFAMHGIARLREGVKFTFMPMANTSDLNAQLMGGHVDLLSGIISSTYAQVKSGDFKCLAVFTEKREPEMPDVPTATEQGYPIVLRSYMGLAAPKGVPADRLAILRKAFADAYNGVEFQDFMKKTQTPATYMDGEKFGKLCADDYITAREELKAMGLLKK